MQAPAAAAPPSAPPNVILLGVVMDGQNARAVVQVGADKRLLRAQMGDDIDGWKVAQIDGRKVVLASQDGRFATYRLFNDERGGAGANGGAASDRPKIRRCSKLRRRPADWSLFNRRSLDRAETQFGFIQLAELYRDSLLPVAEIVSRTEKVMICPK